MPNIWVHRVRKGAAELDRSLKSRLCLVEYAPRFRDGCGAKGQMGIVSSYAAIPMWLLSSKERLM